MVLHDEKRLAMLYGGKYFRLLAEFLFKEQTATIRTLFQYVSLNVHWKKILMFVLKYKTIATFVCIKFNISLMRACSFIFRLKLTVSSLAVPFGELKGLQSLSQVLIGKNFYGIK